MRFVLLALMIALLPLRAWLGDSMAMQGSPQAKNTIEIVAIAADPIRAGATIFLNSDNSPLPCHETAPAKAHPSAHSVVGKSANASDFSAHGDCVDCSLCQVCHSVALTSVINALPLLAVPAQSVLTAHTLFASVPRAPHIKPPIF